MAHPTNEDRKKNYAKGRRHIENAMQRYSTEDNNTILTHKISDREISKLINRSVQAIQIQRTRLKKRLTIEP